MASGFHNLFQIAVFLRKFNVAFLIRYDRGVSDKSCHFIKTGVNAIKACQE